MPLQAFLLMYLFQCGLLISPAVASTTAGVDSLSATRHTQLFGIGHTHLLDTYLSPVAYTGPVIYIQHDTERLARWGGGAVTVQGHFSGHMALPRSQADDDKAMDGGAEGTAIWHWNTYLPCRTRLAIGGMAEMGVGFSYLMRGGNNPAQGRLYADVGLSALCEQPFRIGKRHGWATLQVDLPLMGAMFSPNYGQSYYEIFSLGHYDHNVCLTHPFNAPSGRCKATITIPFCGAYVSLGYGANIRQSDVNRLKQHSWNHSFLIGFVRNLRLLR